MTEKTGWLVVLLATSTLGATSLGRSQSLPAQVVPHAKQMIVRVVADEDQTKKRVASGFLWPDKRHVVTALHVVAGDDNVTVQYALESGKIDPHNARIERVLLNADLALLAVDEPLDRVPGSVHESTDANPDQVWVLGYPLGIPEAWSRPLTIANIAPSNLRSVLEEEDRTALEDLGFPSLNLSVVMLAGDLVPGDSGAPIIDAKGEIIAIGSGGLKSGTLGLGWAMSSARLNDLLNSTDTAPVGTEDFLGRLRSMFVYSAAAARSSSTGIRSFHTSFEAEGAAGSINYFIPVEPIFEVCSPLSSAFTTWQRNTDANSGRYSVSLNPEGNPPTSVTRTNYCQSPSVAVSAAVLDPVFDTSGSRGLAISYFRKTRSNPRPKDVHNCDSALNIYVSRDKGPWDTYSAMCGQFGPESDGWQEMRLEIPAEGADTMRLGFEYQVQNVAQGDPNAFYLIDDFDVRVQ